MVKDEIYDRIFNGVYEDFIRDLNNLDKAYDLLPLVIKDEIRKEEMRNLVVGDYLEKVVDECFALINDEVDQ